MNTIGYLNQVTACLTLFPFYDWLVWRQEYNIITNFVGDILRLIETLKEAAGCFLQFFTPWKRKKREIET